MNYNEPNSRIGYWKRYYDDEDMTLINKVLLTQKAINGLNVK